MTSIHGEPLHRRPASRAALTFGAALLAIGATIGALLAVPEGSHDSAIWKGHRTVLVDAAIPETDVLSALHASGFKRVISASTQPVLVTDWAELETMTLATALHRLVAADPRRDPYIDELPKWFAASVDGKAYRALYLPVSGAIFPERRLIEALSAFPGKYRLPDGTSVSGFGRGARRLFSSLFGVIMLASCILSASNRRRRGGPARRMLLRYLLRGALAVPWICLAAAGLPAAAIAALFGVAIADIAGSLDLPFEELIRSRSPRSAFDSLRRQKQTSPLLAFTACFAIALTPDIALPAALALLASIFAGLAAIAAAVPPQAPGRTAFVPKPIRAAGLGFKAPSMAQAALACAVIVLWAFSSQGLSPRGSDASLSAASLPRPSRTQGSMKPYAAEARSRIAEGPRDRLPDLADWLAHIAEQEALPLERIGARRIDAFESVSISRPGGDVDMLVFDDAWARDAYRKISADSIEGMLAAQGRAVRAAIGIAAGIERPLAPIRMLRYILLLVPPLCGIAAGCWVSRVSTASGTRQEA